VYFGPLFALLRARADVPVLALSHADDLRPASRASSTALRTTSSVRAVLERVGLLLACALGVAVFFGGWQLPGVSPSRSFMVQLVAAVLFVVKTWTLEGILEGVASIASPWTASEARAFVVRRLVPGLLLGALLVEASRRFAPSGSLSIAWGATVAFAALLLAARSGFRVRGAMLRPQPHASPFL
jgi:NADH-quinone oxidoreductase subunit H